MAKIASVDNKVLNGLFASELSRAGIKVAAEGDQAPDAFKDHKEFLAVIESVMADDKNVKGSQDPNDVDFD